MRMCLRPEPLASTMPAASVTGELDEPTKVLEVELFTYTKSQSGALTFTVQLVLVVLQGPPLSSVVRVTVKLPALAKVMLVDELLAVPIVTPVVGLTVHTYEPFPMAPTAGGKVAAKLWVEPIKMLFPQAALIIGGEYGK